MGQIYFSDKLVPFLFVAVDGSPDREDSLALDEFEDEMYAAGTRVYTVTDLSRAGIPTSRYRKHVQERLAQTRHQLTECIRVAVMVVENPVLRFVLNAILLAGLFPMEHKLVGSAEMAIDYAIERMKEEGISPPDREEAIEAFKSIRELE